MYLICEKETIGDRFVSMIIHAPYIAKKALAGQFVIIRAAHKSERIPFTIAGYDRNEGTVRIIFQIAGNGTEELNCLQTGDFLQDIVGPIGRPSEMNGIKKAVVVGGGVGCAIALPILKALYAQGTETYSVVGFRNQEMVILEKDFAETSDEMVLMTDDGSYGKKGLVTDGLQVFLNYHDDIDCVYVIGPLIMMKHVSELTKKYGIKTVVSMNPIMVDGTGMCGGCRLTVGGETKFACIDGPEFDGHLVDYDEVMKRNKIYDEVVPKTLSDKNTIDKIHKENREKHCNLFKEVQHVQYFK